MLKLTYFPLPGRAFAIRTCLGIANISFEDEKIPFTELGVRRGAAGRSADIPLGALPVLTLADGRVVTQSMAIARYAAKLAKLYPEDPLEALFVDEVIETVSDISNGIPRNADPEVFKKLREEYAAGKLKTFMTYLAEKLEKSPYTTGANLTVADIALYGTLKYLRKGLLDHISADYDSQWPVFQTFIDTLENNATFAPYKL